MAASLALVQDITPAQVSEDDLRSIAASNRRRAHELIVRKYREPLYYHALYVVKNAQEALDVVQEVFIRSFRERRLFTAGFRIRAWLFRVCTNLCYNIVRDKKRRGGLLDQNAEHLRGSAPVQAIEEAIAGQERDQMLASINRLPEAYRTILLLRYYDDLSYKEIADVLDIKLGTVMSRLSRAKTRLHGLMERESV